MDWCRVVQSPKRLKSASFFVGMVMYIVKYIFIWNMQIFVRLFLMKMNFAM